MKVNIEHEFSAEKMRKSEASSRTTSAPNISTMTLPTVSRKVLLLTKTYTFMWPAFHANHLARRAPTWGWTTRKAEASFIYMWCSSCESGNHGASY
jgi:hypothetical protein